MSKSFFRKQAIELFQSSSNQVRLKKSLTSFDLTLFGIGAIIGVGIFVLTGITAANYSGPAVTISYGLAAIIAIFTAFAYLEMAAIVPSSGSSYNYAYVTLGELTAWLVGWFMLFEYSVGSALIADGWSGYVCGILHDIGIHLPHNFVTSYFDGGILNLPAIFIIWFLSAILITGNEGSSIINNILVFVKIIAIIVFVIIAVPHANLENWNNFTPFGWSGVMTGTAVLMLSYVGFDALTAAAEEVENPRKSLPIAIIASLSVCAILYILVSAYLTLIVPYYELNNSEPMAYALKKNHSNIGKILITIGAIAGITTSLIVQIYGQSRMMYAISRDRLIPPIFNKVSKTFKTPRNSILGVAVVVSLIAGILDLKMISNLASIGTLFTFAIVSFAVIYLRITQPSIPRSFKSPALFITGPIALISCLYLLIKLLVEGGVVPFIIWCVIGVTIYIMYGYKHSMLNKQQ